MNERPLVLPFDPAGIDLDRRRGLSQQLYQALRARVLDGRLSSGTRLPATRDLAAMLALSRNSVVRAYDQLYAEGYIESRVGDGTYVSRLPKLSTQLSTGLSRGLSTELSTRSSKNTEDISSRERSSEPLERLKNNHLPPTKSGAPRAFRVGIPAFDLFPFEVWAKLQAGFWRNPDPARLGYGDPAGERALRELVAAYMRRSRGLSCTAEQIVITHGAQQAISLCAQLLLQPGDKVAVENPGYRAAGHAFAIAGARVIGVAVDEQGMDCQRLAQVTDCRLAYVTPAHQYPPGVTMSLARRLALLDWAERNEVWIVEDDYDGEFRYGQRPIDALASLDVDDRQIYVGTFSKALSPQLRLGYLVLPPALVAVFRRAKQLIDRHAPLLEQRAMAALIDSGVYERHVRRGRRENERRRVALLNAIVRHLPSGTQILGAAAGLHMVVRVPGIGPSEGPGLVASAARKGVGIYLLAPLFAHARRQAAREGAGLVLGYASLSIPQIDAGVRLLGEAVKEVQAMPPIRRRG